MTASLFTAGQKIRASDINAALPLVCSTPFVGGSGQSVTSSTTLVACTGLSLTLEADSAYVFEGYLPYDAGATGDLKVALTAPAGAAGHWGLFGLGSSTTGGIGDVDARRVAAFGTGSTRVAGGSDANGGQLVCFPHGAIETASVGGTLDLYFAQNASSVTSTSIRFGAWLIAHKVA